MRKAVYWLVPHSNWNRFIAVTKFVQKEMYNVALPSTSEEKM